MLLFFLSFLKMGKTIYCISNGSPNIFPKNTLTSFGNQFPFFYDYGIASSDYKLQVAVDAIGFSLKFNQHFLPDPMVNPCIILEYEVERKKESKGYILKNNILEQGSFADIDEYFKEQNKNNLFKRSYKYIHFENSVLNTENINTLFKNVEDILQVSFKSETNTIQLKFHYKNVNVYFNSLLFPFIKVSAPKLTIDQVPTMDINNNTYELYSCKQNFPILIDLNGVFSLNLPKIIKVKCKNIRDQIFNNAHEKDLLVFCPEIQQQQQQQQQKTNYFFHEFESRTYCTFENTILDHITFDLVNEFNEPLHLDTGIPTLLKLDIIAMEKSKKSFNIRIASDSLNRSNFTIRLPQTLHFNEHWHVSLSSINLPNTFNTFSTTDEHLTIIFKYQTGGFKWGSQNIFVSDGKLEFQIPNKVYSKSELIDLINLFLQNNELNIHIGEITEVTPAGQHKTTTKLTLRSHGLLGFPLQFLELFGKCNQETSVNPDGYVYFFHGHQAIEDVNPQASISVYEFDGPVNIDFFKPGYIMLYSDCIKPIAVSGIYMNIMKIFPTSPLNIPYVIKEFKNIEYLALNNYEIKELNFQLRNHAGELISFDKENPNPVILNLHFSNYSN
jgi:hypothetical protein